MFESDSLYDPTFTFIESKLSCWSPMYYAHVVFAYATCIIGILAMITRIKNSWNKYHFWTGRFYVIFMLWTTAASLLIHNEGLPTGVLYSFVWCLLGLSLGWLIITVHSKTQFGKSLIPIGVTGIKGVFLRVVSLKSIHGYLMFVSWINIAGRLFVTPLINDFTCYTIPAYKLINTTHGDYTNKTVQPLPHDSPDYSLTPWANSEQRWAAMLSLGPLFAGIVFAIIWISVSDCLKARKKNVEPLIHQ